MNNYIKQRLLKIGLQEKEVEIYIKSLELGPQAASTIANKSKINRSTVYDIFNGLIQKGLAYKIDKTGTTAFGVLEPEKLIDYLEREKQDYIRDVDKQKQEISNIIIELKSLQNPLTSKPKIQIYEGKKGMREAYELILESRSDLRAYANVEEMKKGLPNFFPDFFKRRKDKEIFVRALFSDNKISRETAKKDKDEYRETKFIDHKKYPFSPETIIWDNKVLIVSWREQIATLIISQEIADMHINTFDLLWEKL